MKAHQKEQEISEREFENYLDDIYGDVDICGMKYSAGRALKELDPIAFNCAKSDYESELTSDKDEWVCGKCDEVFDNEEDADVCCQPVEEPTEEEKEIKL